MSDISVLSNQYEKLVGTSDKINHSVIAFKKKSLLSDRMNIDKYPKLSVSQDELVVAKDILLSFLRNILKIIGEEGLQSEFIPPLVIGDYKKKLLSQTYLKEDIGQMIEHFESGAPLTDSDIEILDKILSILDSERSMLFRKLRKARG